VDLADLQHLRWAARNRDAPADVRERALRLLWAAGDLSWKLHPDQREFYEFLVTRIYDPLGVGIPVGNIHRQGGKSFALLLVASEFAIRNEGVQIRFVAPTQKELRKIIRQNFRPIFADCPKDLRPTWNGVEGMYEFPNESCLHVIGANNDHEDDARGPSSHLNVIDEAGFLDRLDYMLKDVLLPQTLTTRGRTVIISTPPESPAHELIPILRYAESGGDYFLHTIDQTTHIDASAKEKLIKEMGGRESTKVQRELFCKIVVDSKRAVIPEADDDRMAAIVQPVPPPTFEQPMVVMDIGFKDFTHPLFGYYDFRRARLCIQAEDRWQRMTTDVIANGIKAVEARLWRVDGKPDGAWKRPAWPPASGDDPRTWTCPHRVADVDLIVINDLSKLHGLPFTATDKDLLEAMVNETRMWVKSGRIQVDPSCVNLIRQMKSAIWTKARDKFERTEEEGHFDGLASLIYFVRAAPVHTNPYPAFPADVSQATHAIRPQESGSGVLRELFGRAR
jgi:hypothetical protein